MNKDKTKASPSPPGIGHGHHGAWKDRGCTYIKSV